MVPVNLRPLEEAYKLGNRFGLVPLVLPIGIANPIERLIAVRARMAELKGSYQPLLAFGILALSGLMIKPVQSAITGLFAKKATAVMTNVPGPSSRSAFAAAPSGRRCSGCRNPATSAWACRSCPTRVACSSQRGDYDSDKTACLTLEEFERWLAVAITKYYHLRPHEGMDNEIPLHRYEQGLLALTAANKTIPIPRDPRTFLIDFLPVVRRSLQRDGITIDHITYYSNALHPWIQLRNQPAPLLIRRDPRDLSRIFVLDAENNVYLEVPYRMLSRRLSRYGSTS